MDIICFEYILLEFDKLIDWIYAPDDEFLMKRSSVIRARELLVSTIQSGELNYKMLQEIMEYDDNLGNHNIEHVDQQNICIVARTHKLLDGYIAGLQQAGIKSFEIKANKIDDRSFEGVRIATMHRVKGLEFDHVFVAAANKKVLPFGSKADFEDDISLEEFRTGEKCLLYVALTRARKSAYISCFGGLSELIV